MVLSMNKKEIILGVLGIVIILVVAFFLANMIHDYNVNNLDLEDDRIMLDGEVVNFKTYKVDDSFFLNVPDTFIMLDEETLKSKYNYNSRPELVFMSSDDLEHIFISTTNQDMTDDGLENYLNDVITGLTDMTVLDSGVYKEYDKVFAKLVITNTNTYYNIRFFTVDNKLVTMEFNIPIGVYKAYEDVVNEVMDSICFDENDIKKYSSD